MVRPRFKDIYTITGTEDAHCVLRVNMLYARSHLSTQGQGRSVLDPAGTNCIPSARELANHNLGRTKTRAKKQVNKQG